MKLAFLVLVVVGVIGLGFYRGWFDVSTGGPDNKRNITVTMNKDSIQKDTDKAVEKARDLGQQAKDMAAATTQKADSATTTTTQKDPG